MRPCHSTEVNGMGPLRPIWEAHSSDWIREAVLRVYADHEAQMVAASD